MNLLEQQLSKLKDLGIEIDTWVDIPDKVYFKAPGINATNLKILDKECPMKLKWKIDNPDTTETEALMLGRATHRFLLENELFDNEYAVAPTDNKRTREWKAFQLKIGDEKNILRPKDYEMLEGMIESLKSPKDKFGTNTYDGIVRHPDSIRERALFTVDKKRDILMKVKVDIYLNGMVLDLKTTRSAKPINFAGDMARLGYDIQAVFYLNAVKNAGFEAKRFGFIAIEKEPPFTHSVIVMSKDDIELSRSKLDRLLDEYTWCVQNNKWPGYGGVDEDGNEPLFIEEKLPNWYRYILEEENNFMGP